MKYSILHLFLYHHEWDDYEVGTQIISLSDVLSLQGWQNVQHTGHVSAVQGVSSSLHHREPDEEVVGTWRQRSSSSSSLLVYL